MENIRANVNLLSTRIKNKVGQIMAKMTFGKYRGFDIAFINSGYLKWLIDQDWFVMKTPENLVVAVEKELKERDRGKSHFYDDKVDITKGRPAL